MLGKVIKAKRQPEAKIVVALVDAILVQLRVGVNAVPGAVGRLVAVWFDSRRRETFVVCSAARISTSSIVTENLHRLQRKLSQRLILVITK